MTQQKRSDVENNFDEVAYLRANPDVAAAVRSGQFKSGRQHYDIFGRSEKRCLLFSDEEITDGKKQKLSRIRSLLRDDIDYKTLPNCYDFLSSAMREEFNIIDTSAVSSNRYDPTTRDLIYKHSSGWVLDCGAGKRDEFFDNVVNFEIVDYPSTDVRGVGEVLPFKDESMDAVISIAVLEHVKDPFRCAQEIKRVLKPGGDLICCVPFLQPYHGYPHHYYNMTWQGLSNIFEDEIDIHSLSVPDSVLPIWSLTWILNSWANGLSGKTKRDFMNMRVKDLMDSPIEYLGRPFVRNLKVDTNLELASAVVLTGQKRNNQ